MENEISRWIFLRGLARSKVHWGSLEQELLKLNPKFELEFLDLAGNGEHVQKKSHSTISSYVDDLLKESQLWSSGEKVNLCAISMGAMVATEWAKRAPERISQLVFINTSTKSYSPFYDRLRPTSLKQLATIMFHHGLPLKREQLVLKLTTVHHEKLSPEWAEIFSKIPATSTLNFFAQLFAASRFIAPKQSPVPCSFLIGAQDQLVSPDCSKSWAKHWNSNLLINQDAGHDLPLDCPTWLAKEIFRLSSR